MKIFVVRTTTGREAQVIEKLKSKVKQQNLSVYSLLRPKEIKGYFFVEAEEADDVNRSIYGVTHAKGLLKPEQPLSMEDVKKFLSPVAEAIKINLGDTVDIISGPFKGEKAKVKRITKVKEEVVVELIEAAVPIPITVKIDSVRVVRSEADEGK